MKKEKTTISANEINRFVYCPYQWYYGKIYGSKKLRELTEERNKNLNLKDSTLSNFKRGLEYHSNYHNKYIFKQRIYKGIIISIVLILLVLFFIFRTELGV